MKVYQFNSHTKNNRTAKTKIFMPGEEIVVINQRILATETDIKEGCFSNHKCIKQIGEN